MSGHWNNGCLKLTGRVFSGNSWERDEIEASLFSLKLFNHPSSGNVQICVHVGTLLETQPWGPCLLLLFFYISSSSLWLLVVFEQLRRLFFRATQLCLLCTCSGCLLVHVVRCLCPPPPHHGNLPLMFKSRLPIVRMLILSLLLLFCPNVCFLIKSVNQGSSHQLLIEQKCIKISTQNNVQPLQLDF